MKVDIYSEGKKIGEGDLHIISNKVINLPNDGKDRYIIRGTRSLKIDTVYRLKPDSIDDTLTVKVVAYGNGEYECLKVDASTK